MIKTTFCAAALLAATSLSATAGGMGEPIIEMEPVVVATETEPSGNASGLLQWLMLAGVIIAATTAQ